MNQARRRGNRGLTLIEILLALIVMVLGIVGILALFPPALDSAKESMEVTNGAIIGESVANALTNAVRFAQFEGTTGAWQAVLTHDLETSAGQRIAYPFGLPKFSTEGMMANKSGSNWRHHPGNMNVIPDVSKLPAFVLGGDPWTRATLNSSKENSEGAKSDPLDQFCFSFRVRKINTLAYLLGTMKPNGQPWTESDLEPLTKLYEFQIFIFRLFSSKAASGKTVTMDQQGAQPKRLVATLTCRVSTK